MKKFICLLIMILLVSMPISFADVYDTTQVLLPLSSNGTIENIYSYSDWLPTSVTGTRYVFRVYNEVTGKFEAVDTNYYINHTFPFKRDSNGNLIVNQDVPQDIMFWGADKTLLIEPYANNIRSNYLSSKLNHIIKWIYEKNPKLDNFGLFNPDIDYFAGLIQKRANELGDSATASKMQKVIERTVPFDIRAEMLFYYKTRKINPEYNNNGPTGPFTATVTGNNSIDEYSFSFYGNHSEYLTYLEIKAIGDKYGMTDTGRKVLYDVAGNYAQELYEDDQPYVYVNETFQCTCKGKHCSQSKNVIREGWDYIRRGTEGWGIVEYKDIDTGTSIKNSDMLKIPASKTAPQTITYQEHQYEFQNTYSKTGEKKKITGSKVDFSKNDYGIVVTFWYKKAEEQIQEKKVEIKYRLWKNNTPFEIPSIGKTYDDHQIINQDTEFEINATYRSTIEGMGYEFLDSALNTNAPGNSKTTKRKISVKDNTTQIVFYFKEKDTIKVTAVGVYNGNVINGCTFINAKDYFVGDKIDVGPYTADNWDKLNGYTPVPKYEVFKDNSLVYTGSTSRKTAASGKANKVSTSVTKNEFEGKNGTAVNKVLIVFYYNASYTITYEHINKTTGERIGEIGTVPLLPGTTKTIPTLSNTSLVLVPEDTLLDNKKTSTTPVSIAYDAKNHTVKYYYKEQQLNVEHRYTGTDELIKAEGPFDLPHKATPLSDYTYIRYVLNPGTPQEKTGTATEKEVNVDVNTAIPDNQKLIFYYKQPDVYLDPDPDTDKGKTAVELGCGIIPQNMNNQLIGQETGKYYWVLDEKGTLKIIYADDDVSNTRPSITTEITFPFDIYYNNTLKRAGTTNTYPISYSGPTKQTVRGVTYNKYEGNLTGIFIPVWVEEKEYSNIRVTVKEKFDNGVTKEDSGNGKVTIVGAVYDFTVTNIDGSDTTGDSTWKMSLITDPVLEAARNNNNTYEANILPIGQATQQNTKYIYGIKKGTRFYFSLNTKGAANQQIEITPKFYYIPQNGGTPEEIIIKSGTQDITKLTRKALLTDANRTTTEFQDELSMGKSLYSNAYTNSNPTIFANGKIVIGTGLRTPFVAYGTRDKEKYDEVSTSDDKSQIYRSVSHWYADYTIPNDATFYKKDGKTQLPTDAYIVVGFSIVTKKNASDTNGYLAYNLSSPFSKATNGESEWRLERKNLTSQTYAAEQFVLPKTAVNENGINVNQWLLSGAYGNYAKDNDAFIPVIIYQGSQSTIKNVESTGTH